MIFFYIILPCLIVKCLILPRFVMSYLTLIHLLEPNKCLSESCYNNATCIHGNTSYTCICVTGYDGENCDIGKFSLHNASYKGGALTDRLLFKNVLVMTWLIE